MISLLITLLVLCLILGIVWWAINQIPLPQPIRTIVVVVFALIVVLILLHFLMPFAGTHWRY